MPIDIVEIWFGIAYGQISSIFDRVICPPQDSGKILIISHFTGVAFDFLLQTIGWNHPVLRDYHFPGKCSHSQSCCTEIFSHVLCIGNKKRNLSLGHSTSKFSAEYILNYLVEKMHA